MSEWTNYSAAMDPGGFILQLRLEPERAKSEIRLLHCGVEIAHGLALDAVEKRCLRGIVPGHGKEGPIDIHVEEIGWIAEQLGIAIELKAEVDEEDDDED
jgi:hypothetical protein